MTTQEPDEPCQPTHGIRHYAARTNGVNLLSSRLPTRLANAIDAHAGYLDEVTFGICHAVLIELGNWELIAKGSTSPSSTRRATSLQDAQLVDRRATDPSRQKHLYSTAGEHGTTHKLPERQDFPTRTEVDRLPRLLKRPSSLTPQRSHSYTVISRLRPLGGTGAVGAGGEWRRR